MRAILGEAKPTETAETQAAREFRQYEINAAPPLICIEQSARARAEREIHRIALTYGWGTEVTRQLDRHRAASVSGLDDDTVDQLLDHMRRLLDRAMNACDSDEDLPAR